MVILASLVIVALGFTIYSIFTAPVGYEDERGFWIEKKSFRQPGSKVLSTSLKQSAGNSVPGATPFLDHSRPAVGKAA